MIGASNDPRLNESYAKLPETTRSEKLNKATVARQIRHYEDMARLAGAAVKEDPKDLSALETYLGALLAMDKRPDALAALDEAIKANPDKAERLQPARERLRAAVELANATPQQVYQRRKQLHNFKYFTWVEQQQRDANDLRALWSPDFWDETFAQVDQWDQMIEQFNQRISA